MIEDRCRLAEQAGAVLCAAPDDEGLAAVAASLDELTSGRGADHVFLAAGGSSNAPVETAAKLARDRARVVDIGKTKLDLPWNAYYDKELDVRFSRSYGPGRYDDRYELEGIDYPAGYVRWTERRNLECFLDLLARKDLEVETLVSGTFPMHDAGLGLRRPVLRRAEGGRGPARVPGAGPREPAPAGRQPGPLRRPVRPGQGLEGAERTGQQAPGHRLHRRGQLRLLDAASAPGAAAERAADARRDHPVAVGGERPAAVRLHHRLDQRPGRAGRRVAGRDLHRDPPRHPRGPGLPGPGDRQGGVRGEAARADRRGAGPDHRGDRQDRQRPADGRVQPALRPDAGQDEGRLRPGQLGAVTRYLVNAGPLAADSWYRNEGEGSRFTGEGGHFLDTLSWWADSLPEEVYAVGGGPDSDDVQVTVRFGNGASGVISYLTGGNVRFPKETLDATGGGRSARLDNFRKATVWAGRGHDTIRARGGQDKGQRAEMARFVEACLAGAAMPIPLESLAATTRATIAVRDSLLSGKPEQV